MAIESNVIFGWIDTGVTCSTNHWKFPTREEVLKFGLASKQPGDSEVGKDEQRVRKCWKETSSMEIF